MKVCDECGIEYSTNNKNKKFCSKECRINWLKNDIGLKERLKLTSINDKPIEVREREFKEKFNKKYIGLFEYHAHFKGSEELFECKCLKCGHIQERNASCVRRNREMRCDECVKVNRERKAAIKKEQNAIMATMARTERLERKQRIKRIKDSITYFHECNECGNLFETSRLSAKYCSSVCMNKHNNSTKKIRKRNRVTNNGEFDDGISLSKLYVRDNGICHICGGECDKRDFSINENKIFIARDKYPSIDHVFPISKGGSHTWDNVKLAHFRCNSIKRDIII